MYDLLELDKLIDIHGIYTYFYSEHDNKYKYAGEKHDFWEMVYVDSGEIYEIAGNTGYILSQGDVIFHKPMEFHNLASVNNKPHNILIVTFATKSKAMSFFENKIFKVNHNQKKYSQTSCPNSKKPLENSITAQIFRLSFLLSNPVHTK